MVRDRNNVTEQLPASALEEYLGEWVLAASKRSKARKAFEDPDLRFLQDYVAQRAAAAAGDR